MKELLLLDNHVRDAVNDRIGVATPLAYERRGVPLLSEFASTQRALHDRKKIW
jgi:hypothetical protein